MNNIYYYNAATKEFWVSEDIEDKPEEFVPVSSEEALRLEKENKPYWDSMESDKSVDSSELIRENKELKDRLALIEAKLGIGKELG